VITSKWESPVGKAVSRVFKSGNSEAVRLPRDVAFGREIEVTIIRSGDVLTIYPSRPSVEDMVKALRAMPPLPEVEVRDTDLLPERPGL
jgi:antitoxin VapB